MGRRRPPTVFLFGLVVSFTVTVRKERRFRQQTRGKTKPVRDPFASEIERQRYDSGKPRR
ncbi:hypothetical protein ACQKKX_19640 [Neorhizobium sp. NPDC001467]|uniref:hypothetical protein n=1 Tax=Neorhizobium sp. NPDC001467 TaxID=3390595 RepID=UPI003CFF771D